MIIYADTSVLLKLYINEAHSDWLAPILRTEVVITQLVTYAELSAALAKASRMGRIDDIQLKALIDNMNSDWKGFRIIDTNADLVKMAGSLALRFGLRGFDSVQLAAAQRAFLATGQSNSFRFSVFDQSLVKTAKILGMKILVPLG